MQEIIRKTTDELQEKDGWYAPIAMYRIKGVLRTKYFALLEGKVSFEEECQKILDFVPPQSAVDADSLETRKRNEGAPISYRVRDKANRKSNKALAPEQTSVRHSND